MTRVSNTANCSSDFPNTERRKSIADACMNCVPRQVCSLCRARWYQQIMTVGFYSRNATVLRQGEPADRVYAIRHGWVQVTHVLPNGKSISDLFGPGSVLGVSGAVTNGPYPYTGVTLEDCEIESAETGNFLEYLRKDPYVAVDLLRFVSRQTDRLLTMFFRTAGKVPSEERLLETLWEIAATCSTPVDGGVRINLPLQVQVLADTIGCSRQWVSKMLAGLKSRGVLRRNGSWITLLDRPAVTEAPVTPPRSAKKIAAALKAAPQLPFN